VNALGSEGGKALVVGGQVQPTAADGCRLGRGGSKEIERLVGHLRNICRFGITLQTWATTCWKDVPDLVVSPLEEAVHESSNALRRAPEGIR